MTLKGFIKRYVIHLEWHRGYKPHFSIRPMPRQGDRVVDAGVNGTLRRCPTCSGVGFLHVPDPDQVPGIGLLGHSPEIGIYMPPSQQFLREVEQGFWHGRIEDHDDGIVVQFEKQDPSQEKHGS